MYLKSIGAVYDCVVKPYNERWLYMKSWLECESVVPSPVSWRKISTNEFFWERREGQKERSRTMTIYGNYRNYGSVGLGRLNFPIFIPAHQRLESSNNWPPTYAFYYSNIGLGGPNRKIPLCKMGTHRRSQVGSDPYSLRDLSLESEMVSLGFHV